MLLPTGAIQLIVF